ncbi:MAG: hypothetical protein HY304_01530 [candidate division Zixibacteria bacterium]|nr:hypothetical protein [candidate division Zixibacteria bacterium]
MRREIPMFIAFFVGVVCIIQFFIPHKPFGTLVDTFSDWFGILQSVAIWLGALNLLKGSLEKTFAKKTHDRWYGIVVVLSFFLITIIGLFFSGGRGFQLSGTRFDFLYVNIFTPLSSTMFALLAFFVASASYRAFRARSGEATLLLLAAFFVMLGRAPVGDMMTTWVPEGYRLSDVASWIMTYPQVAGQRAIMIGIALGVASASLRLILGLERSYLGGGD